MALIQSNEIGFREFGNDVAVEENDVAKLMYYLNCFCITVNCSNEPDILRFTNYRNWSRLTVADQKKLLALCITLSPDIFEDKIFFQNDVLCQGASNRFYEISQVRHQLLVVSTVAVAGRARSVNKIMTYTMSWMYYCYLQPMQALARRLGEQDRLRRPESSGCTIL